MVLVANLEKKMQKNRFRQSPKISKLNFGDFGLIVIKEGRIELIQLTLIKKIIKNFIRKKKSNIDIIREKIWYFGRPNFLIQKKSKNSRMGKGKGLIERKVIRARVGFILFEFTGVSPRKLQKFCTKINKVCSIKFSIIANEKKYFTLWSKQINYIYYHEKYLI